MEKRPSSKKVCGVCGCSFATRQGLSSHARQHLRHLGVPLSECTNGPIALLYELKESKGSQLDFTLDPKTPMVPPPGHEVLQSHSKTSFEELPAPPKDPLLGSLTSGETSGVAAAALPLVSPHKRTESSGVATALPLVSPHKRTESSGVATALPLVSPPKRTESRDVEAQSSSAKQTTLKPMWAPQDTDAPLSLVSDTSDEVHVCRVCGAWYETRKGLSSHARAHLRQLGVSDASSKISPIALLYSLKNLPPEDARPGTPQYPPSKPAAKRPSLDPPPSSTSSSALPPPPPPAKRPKVPKEYVCVLCGEQFENRKGLGSHARSHLRQIGVSDMLGKTSAVDAIEELASSGVLADIWPLTKGAAAAAKARAQQQSAAPAPSSPAHAPPPPPPPPSSSFPPSGSALSSPGLLLPAPVSKAPKAKKGFRLASAADPPQLKKPKRAPLDTGETTTPTSVDFVAPTFDGQPIPLILCEYCGQLFDSRKGLSCHVRAHLRQLGVPWSSKSSPIDLLRQLMGKGVPLEALEPSSGKKSHNPAFCDLCGFEFSHRKALASHARAHLRQLGVTEWKSDGSKGSPIELLNEWIQKEPAKVAEITQRYLLGDLYIKKKPAPPPAPPLDAVPAAPRSPEPLGPLPGPRAGRELLGVPGASPKAARKLSTMERGPGGPKQLALSDVTAPSPTRVRPLKPPPPAASGQENVEGGPPTPPRPGNIPALLPMPPLTPLVSLVGKVYSLKCRFCDQVFQGPLSVQEDWIAHLQKHILKLGYKGKASPSPAVAMATQSMVDPAAL
ncbi:unnamed protein product [Boreogadus saida]